MALMRSLISTIEDLFWLGCSCGNFGGVGAEEARVRTCWILGGTLVTVIMWWFLESHILSEKLHAYPMLAPTIAIFVHHYFDVPRLAGFWRTIIFLLDTHSYRSRYYEKPIATNANIIVIVFLFDVMVFVIN
jgi:hypothetical protein